MQKETIKFRKFGDRTSAQQFFDKTKIVITKYGKKINVYDAIQEANKNTDIYEVMHRYGESEQNAIERMKKTAQAQYGDFTNANSLRNIQDKMIETRNIYNSLPRETKKEFNNNYYEFLQNGEKYFKEKYLEEKKAIEEYNKKQEIKQEEKK